MNEKQAQALHSLRYWLNKIKRRAQAEHLRRAAELQGR